MKFKYFVYFVHKVSRIRSFINYGRANGNRWWV